MKLSAQLDLGLVALEQPDELTLLVELHAPTPTTTTSRPPATLQVVLDRSGSMGGDRLTGACQALTELLDRLDPTDNLGIVAFDDTAQVVVPAGPVQDKTAVRHAIQALQPGGSTDLSAGYLRGLQEAQRVAGPSGATVLLVSDGHANAGVTDPVLLERVANQAHGHGVSTTTLGFGLGYDEQLLAALARGGRGSELFAEEADTAAAKIAGEVDGLLDQVAQAASLRITMNSDVQALAVLNDLPVHAGADGVTVELGSFYAGESRKLVLRFRVPGIAALGLAQIASLHLTYVALPELVQHTVELPVHVNVVPGDQAAGRIPDPVVRSEALFQLTQSHKRRSSRLLSQGHVDQASRLLRSAADSLRSEAIALPAELGAELLHEAGLLRDMASEADAGHVDRAAKSASYDASSKSRTRGRRASASVLLLRRADNGDTLQLEEWRLRRLRREAAAAGVELRRSRRNGPDVALALAKRLDPSDPLHAFFLGAGGHGGFTIEAA